MENLKLIVISLVLMAAVIGGLVWFKGGEKPVANIGNVFAGELTATENFYDFGSAKIDGGLISHEYAVENKTDKSVKINGVSTSCMCTSAEVKIGDKTYGPFGMPGHGGSSAYANIAVNPGEKIIVKATFDPAAHGPAGIGMVERQIFIDTGAAKPLILNFKVIVTP